MAPRLVGQCKLIRTVELGVNDLLRRRLSAEAWTQRWGPFFREIS